VTQIKLENVAIANILLFEATLRRAGRSGLCVWSNLYCACVKTASQLQLVTKRSNRGVTNLFGLQTIGFNMDIIEKLFEVLKI